MTTPRQLLAQKVSQSQISSFFIDKIGILSVISYGATGSGTTDDTTAIQDALDAANTAGGGIVYLPPGVYLITGTLDLYNNVHLIGAGGSDTNGYTTKISAQVGTLPAIELAEDGTSHYNIVLEGFYMGFTGSGTPTQGILLNKFNNQCVLRNVSVRGFNENIRILNSWYYGFENVTSQYAGANGGADKIGINFRGCNGGHHVNCTANSNQDGVTVYNSKSNSFAGLKAESNSRYGIYVSYCRGVNIDTPYFEGNVTADIITYYDGSASTNNTKGVTITTPYISGSSAYNYGIYLGDYTEDVVINTPVIGTKKTAGIYVRNTCQGNISIFNPSFPSVFSGTKIDDQSGKAIIMDEDSLILPPLAAAPTTWIGRLAMSDGTGSGFDGASGAGLYRRSSTGAWIFVG